MPKPKTVFKVGDILCFKQDKGNKKDYTYAAVAETGYDEDEQEDVLLVSADPSFGWLITEDILNPDSEINQMWKPKQGEFTTGWYYYPYELEKISEVVTNEEVISEHFTKVHNTEQLKACAIAQVEENITLSTKDAIDAVYSIKDLFGQISNITKTLKEYGFSTEVAVHSSLEVVTISVEKDNEKYSLSHKFEK